MCPDSICFSLQVDKAFEHLAKWTAEQENSIHFKIRVGGQPHVKGIYLRGNHGQCTVVQERSVEIEPVFLDNDNVPPQDKVDFDMQLTLVTSGTSRATWLRHATHVNVHYAPKAFAVHVDPTSLPPGLHFAAIKGYESSKPEKGWVLDIPVTVLKPEVPFLKYSENSPCSLSMNFPE